MVTPSSVRSTGRSGRQWSADRRARIPYRSGRCQPPLPRPRRWQWGWCAAAFYPPTNQELSPRYGARHRAALGISEITDSLTVVVSEETGTISFAVNGELRKIPAKELRASLVNELQWFKSEEKEAEK